MGATVQDLHEVGKGCPDILVGYRSRNFLMEIKSKNGKLTEDEMVWIGFWHGDYVPTVRTVREALEVIGAVEYEPGANGG